MLEGGWFIIKCHVFTLFWIVQCRAFGSDAFKAKAISSSTFLMLAFLCTCFFSSEAKFQIDPLLWICTFHCSSSTDRMDGPTRNPREIYRLHLSQMTACHCCYFLDISSQKLKKENILWQISCWSSGLRHELSLTKVAGVSNFLFSMLNLSSIILTSVSVPQPILLPAWAFPGDMNVLIPSFAYALLPVYFTVSDKRQAALRVWGCRWSTKYNRFWLFYQWLPHRNMHIMYSSSLFESLSNMSNRMKVQST